MEMNIYEAIASIMQKGCAIGKEKRNQQQGFMYRGIDDVMNVYNPLMAEAGIFVVPEVLEAKREERQTTKGGNLIYSILKVKYTFWASDGTHVEATVIGEGMDSGDKASNKAMAVAMKYAFFQVFCIPTDEMQDPDAETPEASRPARVPRPDDRDAPPPPTTAGDPRDIPARVQEKPISRADGYYYCSGCGKKITDHGNMTEYQVANLSLQEFGKQLCFECGHAEYMRRSGQ